MVIRVILERKEHKGQPATEVMSVHKALKVMSEHKVLKAPKGG